MTPRFHPLRVAEVRRETPDAVSVRFDVPAELAEAYRFLPGQHLTLKAVIDGRELRRSYSICSAPDDGELRVAIRQVPGGAFSAWANERLQAGAPIEVMTPDGRFSPALDTALPHDARGAHYLLVAAGSGITPILSIARAVLADEPASRVTLLYGNRQLASTMFREALQDLKDRHLRRFAPFFVFSREPQDAPLLSGRIDADKLRLLARTVLRLDTVDAAYVCGPNAMIDAVQATLVELGLPRERVHAERFGTPGETAAVSRAEGDADAATVTFVLDGMRRDVTVRADDPSILEAGVAAGLDLPYACKGGVCSTCRAKLVEGEVRMARNFALEPHELDAGFVLACQCHALTRRVVLSFDER